MIAGHRMRAKFTEMWPMRLSHFAHFLAREVGSSRDMDSVNSMRYTSALGTPAFTIEQL